jgi:hypothetical protein
MEPSQPPQVDETTLALTADGDRFEGGPRLLAQMIELGDVLDLSVYYFAEELAGMFERRRVMDAERARLCETLRSVLDALHREADTEGRLKTSSAFDRDLRWSVDSEGYVTRRGTGEPLLSWRTSAASLLAWLDGRPPGDVTFASA